MTDSLLDPMHPATRSRNSLLSRLGGALARPFQTTYVCPSIMTATAVYALRGYEVYWSAVGVPDMNGRKPSSVAYRVYVDTDDGRYPSHGVSLKTFFPNWALIAERKLRNALMRLRS